MHACQHKVITSHNTSLLKNESHVQSVWPNGAKMKIHVHFAPLWFISLHIILTSVYDKIMSLYFKLLCNIQS